MNSLSFLSEPVWGLLLIAFIVTVSGFVQSSLGFGYAITSLSVMPMILETHSSHIVVSLSGLPVLFMTVCSYKLSVEWSEVRRTLLGAFFLLPVGLFLFASLDQQRLSQVTGLAILFFVFLDHFKKEDRAVTSPPHWLSYLAGGVSGFLAGAVSIGGPPVATYALRRGWNPSTFKSFVSSCLLLIASLKIIGLFAAGFLLRDDLFHAMWAIPFAIGGVLAGTAVSRFIKPRLFRKIITLVLILAASNLIWSGSSAAEPEVSAGLSSGTVSCHVKHPAESSNWSL